MTIQGTFKKGNTSELGDASFQWFVISSGIEMFVFS